MEDRRSSRRRSAVMAFTACAALAALFVPGSSARSAGIARGGSSETLKIAIFTPSKGDFAAQNQLIANGASIAASELSGVDTPNLVGLKLDLIERHYTPQTNPSALLRRAAAGGVSAVVLPCDVNEQPAFAQAAAREKLLMVTPCDPDPKIDARYPMEWPVGMAGNVEVGQIVGYADRENAYYAYLLTANGSSYISELANYFKAAADQNHVKITGESTVSLSSPDISAIAAAIKKHPETRAIFTPIFSPYLEPIIAGLRADGIRIPIYATDGADSAVNLKPFHGALANDVVYGVFGFARPASRRFFLDYHQTYRHSASDSSFPELGYETIRVLDLAASKAGSTKAAAVNAAFAKGFTDTGVALANITYPGHGKQVPVTAAGVVRMINGLRVVMFASYPVGVIPIPNP